MMNRYLSTPSVFAAPVGTVDRTAGVIHGVVIAQEGPAKGHNGFIDKTFLLSIVDDAALKPAGIKARFGHPNMCNTALGSYLGRFRNYAYTGTQVKADLYLDETAKTSPSGDLFSYVLDMAVNNPDMFGASIYFQPSESLIVKELEDGKEIKKEYFRLKELRGTDIVDEPAATVGLFSTTTFPGIATGFLDANPEIAELIFTKPATVLEFFNAYLTRSDMNFSEKVKENFAAFLAAFSDQSDNLLPSPAEQDGSFNMLFDAFCASFPESFANVAGFSQVQKAESIAAFAQSLNAGIADAAAKLAESVSAFDALNAIHQELILSSEAAANELSLANTRIQDLTDQLSARPSIPLNVTDPPLSHSAKDKDQAGKDLLDHLPASEKRRIPKS